MKLYKILTALLAVLVLTLAVAACGDDDDDDSGDDGGSEATATEAASDGGESTPTEAASDGGEDVEAQTLSMVIADFTFTPAEFTVAAGAAVTFSAANSDDVPHTFTVYADEEFTEARETNIELDGGAEATPGTGEVFEAGEYYFRCEVHPTQMVGEFVAE